MTRILLLIVLMLSGCHDDPPVVYPTLAPLDLNQLKLGPGDKLALTVYYGSQSFNAAYTLSRTGQISVQYIGEVAAGGKTVDAVQDEIRTRLADGYINEPIVSLTIVEINSLALSVSGMIAKPGTMKFTPGMTVVDAIAQSGGFTPLARKNMVRVTRNVDGKKTTYKLPVDKMAAGERPSFQMMPGDEVYVPERPW